MLPYKTAEETGKKYVTLCAINVRIDLKNHFPNHKFKVVSKSFAGGNSVDVFCDKEIMKEVDELLRKWSHRHYNMTIDCPEFKSTELHEKYGSTHFISANEKRN